MICHNHLQSPVPEKVDEAAIAINAVVAPKFVSVDKLYSRGKRGSNKRVRTPGSRSIFLHNENYPSDSSIVNAQEHERNETQWATQRVNEGGLVEKFGRLSTIESVSQGGTSYVTQPSRSYSGKLGSTMNSNTESPLFGLQRPFEVLKGSTEKTSSYYFSTDTEESLIDSLEYPPAPPELLLERPLYHPRTALDLSHWLVTDETLYLICQSNRHLTRLSLKGNFKLTDRGLSILGKSQPQLKHLILAYCSGLELKAGLQTLLQSCTHLSSLDISHCESVTTQTLQLVGKYGTNLREFSCDTDSGMSDDSMIALLPLKKLEMLSIKGGTGMLGKAIGLLFHECHFLKAIRLNGACWINDEAISKVSAQKIAWGYTDAQGGLLPLRKFSAADCIRVGDQGMTWLLSKTRQLRELNLARCELVTDVSLELIGKWCAKISNLDVSRCYRVSDKGLKSLTKSQANHNRNAFLDGGSLVGLQHLNISYCSLISDSGVKSICSVLQNVRTIGLEGLFKIGDRSARAIGKNCRLAEEINLSHCPRLTERGVTAIVTQVRTCTTKGFSMTTGKAARQSTTLACRDAAIAVNGSRAGAYGQSYDDENGDVSQTTFEHAPWWEVDLSEVWDIGILRIWSPPFDEMIAYNFPMWILASETPMGNEKINVSTDNPAIIKRCFREGGRCVKWDMRARARYIRIQTTNSGPLLLAQVEAFFRGSTCLRLQGCTSVTSAGFGSLARYFLHIITLDLSHTPGMDDKSLSLMAKNLFNVEHLNISGCTAVTDSGLYEWSMFPRKLVDLDMTGCFEVTGRGILYIHTRCKDMTHLKVGRLRRLTDSALYFIAKLGPQIETLTLHACPMVSEDAIIRVSPMLKYATPEWNLEEGGVDFLPRPYAKTFKYRDELGNTRSAMETLVIKLQRLFKRHLALQRTPTQKLTKHANRQPATFTGVGGDVTPASARSDASTQSSESIGSYDVNAFVDAMDIEARSKLSEKQRERFFGGVSGYSNPVMFAIAREKGRRERKVIRNILNKVGRNYRARLIQLSWRKYKFRCSEIERKRRELEELERHLKSIKLVQRHIRGLLSRRRVAELRAARLAYMLSLQNQDITLDDVDEEYKRDFAAMIIQKFVRVYLKKLADERARIQKWLENKASEMIKRGLMRLILKARGKRLLAQKRFERAERLLCRFQARWRANWGRRLFLKQRRSQGVIARLAKRKRDWDMYKMDCAMATRIQRRIRGMAGRHEYSKRLHERLLNQKAQIIQMACRGYRARKNIAIMKIRILLRLQLERTACLRLQHWFRGRWQRLRFLRVLKITSLRMEGAAITIQRWMWEYIYPRRAKIEWEAAKVIQKLLRCRLFRIHMRKMLRHRRLRAQLEWEEWEEWQHLNRMAVRVQNAWRGREARRMRRLAMKKRAQRIADEMIIQKMQDLQNYMEHVQLRELHRKNATIIQTCARGYLARQHFKIVKERHEIRVKAAAMAIQSQLRSRVAARVIRRLKQAIRLVKPPEAKPKQDADAEHAKVGGTMTSVLADKLSISTALKKRKVRKHYEANPIAVGSIIEGNWDGRQRWFRAQVLRINPPSNMYEGTTYKVLYLDNHIEKRLQRKWIRLLKGETELRLPEVPDTPASLKAKAEVARAEALQIQEQAHLKEDEEDRESLLTQARQLKEEAHDFEKKATMMEREEMERLKAVEAEEARKLEEGDTGEENAADERDAEEEEGEEENNSPEYIMSLANAKYDEAKGVHAAREEKEAEEADLLESAEGKEKQESQLLKDIEGTAVEEEKQALLQSVIQLKNETDKILERVKQVKSEIESMNDEAKRLTDEGKELEDKAAEIKDLVAAAEDEEKEKERLEKEERAREKDPVLIEYGMVELKRRERKIGTKMLSHIPLTKVWWREKRAKQLLDKIAEHRAKHAIYTKGKVSTKIRRGIDDILIILGEKDNSIMCAAQRRNLQKKLNYYECINLDLRANIRCSTNDDLPVYIWFRRSAKPRLVCEIKFEGNYMFGGGRWAENRKAGFERVFSNESRDIPKPDHWTRLPFTIWIRKAVYENPIDDIMVSRWTRTRMEQRACMEGGYIMHPVDLSNFGMDHGLRFWFKYMQEFHDEIKFEHEATENAKIEFRGLNGIPPDIDPSYLADQAGDPEANEIVRNVVEFIGLPDSAVIGLYQAFRRLAKSDVNTDLYITVEELFHYLGLRFGASEYGAFVEIMWDIAKLPLKEEIRWPDFMKLCGIWCIMGRQQILLMVFNSQDPMKDGAVPFELIPSLMWELHKKSLETRRRTIRTLIDTRLTEEEFIRDGSGKWNFKYFCRMDNKFPQLLYPLFYFQWALCDITLGLPFWEKQRAHLHKYRYGVIDEVKAHADALEAQRDAETQAALTRATLKDSVRAILTNKPLPDSATAATIQLAHKRVKKLKKKAAKLHIDINILIDKMK
jgi:chemotaxis protein histidine kinase CheA